MTPKFRAWDKKNKSMHEVELIDFSDNIGYLSIENGRGDWYSFEVDTILMQSTGLKDKNGVEIFDGDIVAVENHPFQRKEDRGVGIEIEGNYVVGWDQLDLTWCAGSLLLARLKPYVKVVGNLYQNSELLEEVKK
ncbi:YopX family protein [Enterococcus pernyi]